jgi:hypothetical protein
MKKSSSSSSEAGRPPSALKRVNPNSKFVSGGKNSEHEETHYSTEQYASTSTMPRVSAKQI